MAEREILERDSGRTGRDGAQEHPETDPQYQQNHQALRIRYGG